MTHTCHAQGCDVSVPPALLMCGRHWRLVPAELQAAVWRAYRRGQETDKRPSALYLAVATAAIAAVAEIERAADRARFEHATLRELRDRARSRAQLGFVFQLQGRVRP